MKKLFSIFLSLGVLSILSVFVLALGSCHSVLLSSWLSDIEVAKATAKKQNKDILLLVSGDLSGREADDWVENNLKTPEFQDVVSLKCVLVNYRFSMQDFMTVQNAATSEDKKELQQAQNIKKDLDKKLFVMDLYQVQNVPCIYLLTKEGYYVASFGISDFQNTTYQDIIQKLTEYNEQLATLNSTLADIYKTTGLEKVTKIDLFLKNTQDQYKHLTKDLMLQLVAADKNNETGLVGDYELDIAQIEVMSDLAKQDFVAASKKMTKVAAKSTLSASQKQQAFYLAGYFLLNSGDPDSSVALSYMQKAIEAAPDTPEAQIIRQNIEYIQQMQEQAKQGPSEDTSDSEASVEKAGDTTAPDTAPTGEFPTQDTQDALDTQVLKESTPTQDTTAPGGNYDTLDATQKQ